MNTNELKKKILSMDLKNIESPSEMEKIIKEIENSSIEDLELYLKEYQDHIYFAIFF